MTKVLIRHVDNWKFWMTMFGFGLAVCGLGVFYVISNQWHENAATEAANRAANSSQVATCFNGAKNAPLLAGFAAAHLALIDNSILSTRAALAATSKSDPLYAIRVSSIKRLKAAKVNGEALQEEVIAQTPTKQKCIQLARMLHVPYADYLANPKQGKG